MKIAQFICCNYAVVSEESSLGKAYALMVQGRHEGMVVVDAEQNPVGILDPYVALNSNPNRLVCDIMGNLLQVPKHTSVEEIFQIFKEHCRSLAVVIDESGQVIGTISEKSILNYFFRINSFCNQLLRISTKEKNSYEILKCILKTLVQYLQVNIAFICQYQQNKFWVRVVNGIDERWEGTEVDAGLDQFSPCALVIRSKQPVVVTDIREAAEFTNCFVREESDYRSFLGIPIHGLSQQPLGVLGICSLQERHFSKFEFKLISLLVPRVREELERENTMVQLLQTDRLANLGILSTGMVHNFSNVLQTIVSGIDFLQEETASFSSHAKELLMMIADAAQKASFFSREVLTSMRTAGHTQQAIDLAELIKILQTIISNTFSANIELKIKLADRLPEIIGNGGELYHAILNLCLNARDAMPEGGILSISVDLLAPPHDYSALLPDSYYVCIAVEDSGVGIPSHISKRITEPFFTTKSEGCGTGLGLFSVKKTVQEHQGYLEYQSTPEKGSVFRIYLPGNLREKSKTTRRFPLTSQLSSGGHDNALILAIEDNDSIRLLMKRVLTRANLRVLLTDNGEDGLKLLGQESLIALVILDMNLPGISGATLFQEIRKLKPDIPVLLISGLPQKKEILLRQKQVKFLQKPYNNKTFLDAIFSLLASTSKVSEITHLK